ncbi:MAG TPA: 6,7-dimethyl-8-ribityllumazine synthase, partial [Bacteroidales bacterium]|nr:6,7-dimethyl-8-ribityllumazine synthase [Bacteroidales bacterium]
ENIISITVPGSFELPKGAKYLIDKNVIDTVICIGCVIQGETRHFEFICQAVSYGIMKLNLETNIPVIFGVLTTNNIEQARERAGGKYGNKGVEAAITAIKMASLKFLSS